MSLFDKVFRKTVAFDFFSKGWGQPDLLMRLVENMYRVRENPDYIRNNVTFRPIMIEKNAEYKKLVEIEGSFVSPMEDLIPGALCTKNRIARFQMIIPKEWKSQHRPVCLHFAGTGDHSYYRRRVFLANKLIDDGIASIIIMNPFYGTRLPVGQKGSGLNYLSDLFLMGGALILECHTLLRWCEQEGYGPFALHGVSMGGYMATICATTVSFPISLIPCLSWTSASVVFLEGVLSHSVDWRTLTKQYFGDSVYSTVIRNNIQPSINPAYELRAQNQIASNASLECDSATKPLIPPPPQSPKAQDYFIDIQSLYQRPLSDVAKVLDHVKSHNRLLLYIDNHIWDSAVSAMRAVPLPSVFAERTKVDPEVRGFLRELLDFFTHLGNFPALADSRLIISVTAGRDAYVPRDGVVPLDVIFPDSEIRTLPLSGHVSSYVRNYLWNQDFRQAVCDSMNRQMALHYGLDGPIFGKAATRRAARA